MLSIKLLNNEVASGKEATLQIQFKENNILVDPGSAKITFSDPYGAIIVDSQAMIIGSGLAEYTLLETQLSEKGENYRIYIDYVYGGSDYFANFLLDVVLTPLVLSVSHSDLLERHPNLTADLYDGETAYTPQIEKAFDIVKKDIKNKGKRPSMIIDASQIENLIELKSLELIYFDFATNEEGINWERYMKYRDQYNQELSQIIIKYDSDEDGIVDTEIGGFSTINLVR